MGSGGKGGAGHSPPTHPRHGSARIHIQSDGCRTQHKIGGFKQAEDVVTHHPQDSIPGYVLGALDAEETARVGRHLAICAACRANAEAFHTEIAGLSHAGAGHGPPARVKRLLLARIAAASIASAAAAPRLPRARPRGMSALAALTAAALALTLALGAVTVRTREQVATLSSQLDQSQRQIERLRGQLAQGDRVARFISASRTLQRRLDSPDRVAGATMYMQPGSRHAVLIVEGLPRAETGTTYQFWLARPGEQVPANTFDAEPDGVVTLEVDAPAPVSQYDQVMVTVEASGGAARPSERVVLSGSLAAALRAWPFA